MRKFDLKQIIVDYVPVDEQEAMDKKTMLHFIDSFGTIASRENLCGHMTASAFVVNESKTDTLLLKHNIFGGYVFPGGHADGQYDLLSVAKREVEEETGLIVDGGELFSVQCVPVHAHIKRNKYVSAHTHYDVAFLFYVKDEDMNKIRILESENSDVKWVKINEHPENLVDWFEDIFAKFQKKIQNNC